jgi:hypothetical protein
MLRKFKELKLNYLLSYNPWLTDGWVGNVRGATRIGNKWQHEE